MLTRRALIPAAIAAAVGVPIIATSEFGDKQSNGLPDAAATTALGDHPELLYMPVANFAEILRFDVDPNWVAARWPRVSTAPAAAGLQGMRVALVTGNNPWDVCGAMTYYFDRERRVQRIQLAGLTGDPGPLIQTLTNYFAFEGHTTTAAGLYTARRGRQVTGLLRLDHAPVLEAENPNQRMTVLLEINRADGDYVLSPTTIAQATALPY
jgi:hypothetical protein